MQNLRLSKIKLFRIRYLVVLIFVLVISLNAFTKSSYGTPCALNILGIPIICPLGAVQVSLASRSFPLEMLLAVVITILIIFLFGRAFCAWACPTLLFKNNKRVSITRKLDIAGNDLPQSNNLKLSYGILGGTLLSSLVFGFPVFCTICPVGLFFGSLFAIVKVFNTHQPGLELLIFPAMFITELVFLKKKCSHLCPLGALLSLISSVNPGFLRPKLNPNSCIQNKKWKCGLCERYCPENIKLTDPSKIELGTCTNCLECKDRCPTNSLTWWRVRKTP